MVNGVGVGLISSTVLLAGWVSRIQIAGIIDSKLKRPRRVRLTTRLVFCQAAYHLCSIVSSLYLIWLISQIAPRKAALAAIIPNGLDIFVEARGFRNVLSNGIPNKTRQVLKLLVEDYGFSSVPWMIALFVTIANCVGASWTSPLAFGMIHMSCLRIPRRDTWFNSSDLGNALLLIIVATPTAKLSTYFLTSAAVCVLRYWLRNRFVLACSSEVSAILSAVRPKKTPPSPREKIIELLDHPVGGIQVRIPCRLGNKLQSLTPIKKDADGDLGHEFQWVQSPSIRLTNAPVFDAGQRLLPLVISPPNHKR